MIWVVGIGPGQVPGMTLEAEQALAAADHIVGYKTYVELVRDRFPEKQYYVNAMGGEVDRCKLVLELASTGQNVALVCSGDAGVYGMAGLLYELTEDREEVAIQVIAGVTAAQSGAARLGAPLSHDYAVISLSDYLISRERIAERLRACAATDMCIVIYNPQSKARPGYLAWAVDILLESKPADTCCGYVRNIGRCGETSGILSLSQLKEFPADMFTTIYIGNRESKVIHGKMVTPRGYRLG